MDDDIGMKTGDMNTQKEPDQSVRVIRGRKNAVAEAYSRSSSSKDAIYCLTGEEIAKSYRPFLPLAFSKIQNGGSVRILADITKQSSVIEAITQLLIAGVQIRHFPYARAKRCVVFDNTIAYFSIADAPILEPSEREVPDGEDIWMVSTDADIIEITKKRFEKDWVGATDAQLWISKLKEDRVEEETLVVRDNQKAMELYKSIAETTKKEALWILPSARSVLRVKRAGIFDILVSAATKGASVRVLFPRNSDNSKLISNFENLTPTLEIRESEPGPTTLLIVDRRLMFTSEMRDDDTDDILQAINNSVYSSSISTIQSHLALFEALWQQKEINEKLIAADEIKQDFINIAAHELRTPIVPILLAIESLQEDIESGDKKELMDKAKIIARNARRMRTLLHNILDATRVENKSFTLNWMKYDVAKFIQTVISDERFKLSFDSPVSIEFQNKLPAEFKSYFDKDRLGQVLSNLIDNAIKFTSAGKVTVTATLNEGEHELISITVKDSGTGIDPAVMDKLFTKFTTKSTNKSGTGLGLYISKAIVEAHGGTITAKNDKDGGASFIVSIPCRINK